MNNLWIMIGLTVSLAACKTKKQAVDAPKEQAQDVAEMQVEMQEEVETTPIPKFYYFSASGQEPDWKLDIDFDKEMRLEIPGSEFIVALPLKETRLNEANNIVLESENGEFEILLVQENCINPKDKKLNLFKVKILVKDGGSIRNLPNNLKELNGCGNYNIETMSLNDIWVLTQIDDKPISADDFMKTPTLEINTKTQSLTGNNGCNSLFGKAIVYGRTVKFGPLGSTKMACMNNKVNENEINNRLGKVNRFTFFDGKLNLYFDKELMLVYKKVD